MHLYLISQAIRSSKMLIRVNSCQMYVCIVLYIASHVEDHAAENLHSIYPTLMQRKWENEMVVLCCDYFIPQTHTKTLIHLPWTHVLTFDVLFIVFNFYSFLFSVSFFRRTYIVIVPFDKILLTSMKHISAYVVYVCWCKRIKRFSIQYHDVRTFT